MSIMEEEEEKKPCWNKELSEYIPLYVCAEVFRLTDV